MSYGKMVMLESSVESKKSLYEVVDVEDLGGGDSNLLLKRTYSNHLDRDNGDSEVKAVTQHHLFKIDSSFDSIVSALSSKDGIIYAIKDDPKQLIHKSKWEFDAYVKALIERLHQRELGNDFNHS